jgi:hypothetical protein
MTKSEIYERNIEFNENTKILIGIGDSFCAGTGTESIEIWEKKFNLLLSFIEKEKRLPIKFKDESKFGSLHKWVYDQNRFYICAPENGVISKEKYKIIWKEFIDNNRNLFVKFKLNI